VNSKRTIIMAGSIVAGLVAALLIFNYVRGIENKQAEGVRLVEVYVAKANIPSGTPGDAAIASGAIAVSQINAEFRPENIITSADEIAAKASLFDIAPNTVITRGMFVDPSQTSLSFQARISRPDYVAVTIQLDQVSAVGGFLSPGDYVNVMVGTTSQNEEQTTTGISLLYQKVRILAVGNNVNTNPQAAAEGAQGGNSGMLTLEVPQEAASLIVFSSTNGSLHLSLVPDSYTPVPVPPADGADLPGQDPARLTPYGPEGFR
jgi:pilus assembly protein CpaB